MRNLDLNVICRSVDDDPSMMELSISTDEPLPSPWGDRVSLSHDPSAIDLGRIANDAVPLLYNHQVHPKLGRIVSARTDGSVLRLMAQWDMDDPEVLPYYKKYQRGFLGNTSVRARTHEMEPVGDHYRVTRWELLEASLVTLPEDPKTGVGRSLYQDNLDASDLPEAPMPDLTPTPTPEAPPPVDIQAIERAAVASYRERSDFIEALGVKFQNPELARQLLHEGKTQEEAHIAFAEYVFKRQLEAQQQQETPKIGLSKREDKSYSILRAIHAATTGDWSHAGLEREASIAIAEKLGKPFDDRKPNGRFFLPGSDLTLGDEMADFLQRQINDMTRASLTSQPTNIGNLIVTNFRANDLIALGREGSLSAKLGVPFLRGLTGIHEFPKQSAGLGFSWRATEITQLVETNLGFNKVQMTPKEFGGLFVYSKLAAWQAEIPMGLEAFARQDFIRSYRTFLDDTLMNGLGTGGAPRGIFNVAGMQSLGTALGANGGTMNPERIKELITKIRKTWLADREELTMVTTMDYCDWVSNQKDANGRYIWDGDRQAGVTNARPDRLWGIPVIDTTYVKSNFTKGTGTNLSGFVIGPWSNGSLLMGEWYGLEMDTSKDFRFDTTQNVVRIIGTMDILARNPECFGMVNEIVTV